MSLPCLHKSLIKAIRKYVTNIQTIKHHILVLDKMWFGSENPPHLCVCVCVCPRVSQVERVIHPEDLQPERPLLSTNRLLWRI